VVGILLVFAGCYAIARYFNKTRHVDSTYKDYLQEAHLDKPDDDSSVEELAERSDPSHVQLTRYSDKPSTLGDVLYDASAVPLDDDDLSTVPTTRKEAKAKQSNLLMQEVELNAKK
jgi:hypothetical protein